MSVIQVLKPEVLQYATTIPFPGGRVGSYIVTMTGDATLANIDNPVEGARYTYLFIQDSTGGRVLSLSNRIRVASGTVPVLTTEAGARDLLEFWSYGGYAYLTSIKQDLRIHVSPPTSITPSTGVVGQIDITWTNPQAGATSYEIYRGIDPLLGQDDIQFMDLVGTSTTTSYSDTTAVPMTDYYYAVRTFVDTAASLYAGSLSAGSAA